MDDVGPHYHHVPVHFKKTNSYQYAVSLLISFVVASLLTYIIPQIDGTDLIAIIVVATLFYWIVLKDVMYFFLVSDVDENLEWGEYVDQALNIGLYTFILLGGIYTTGYLSNVFTAQTRPLSDIIIIFIIISIFVSIALVLSNPVPDVDQSSEPVLIRDDRDDGDLESST